MFKKNNFILFIIFILLVIIAAAIIFFGESNKTFDSTLSDIDSSSIDKIEIYPKSLPNSKIILKKISNQWKVKIRGGKFVDVTQEKSVSIISQMINLKPSRIIGSGKNLFSKYEVDEKASRIKLFSNDNLLLDIFLGKFFLTQPRNVSSCVRLADEEKIYEIENFLSIQFDQNENYFRNSDIIIDDYLNWERLVFIYSDDSSFQITNRNQKWFLENTELDSALIHNYLMSIQRISSTDFYDGININDLQPSEKLIINKNNGQEIILSTYNIDGQKIIKSSENKDNIFDCTKSELYNKIFVSKAFLQNQSGSNYRSINQHLRKKL